MFPLSKYIFRYASLHDPFFLRLLRKLGIYENKTIFEIGSYPVLKHSVRKKKRREGEKERSGRSKIR